MSGPRGGKIDWTDPVQVAKYHHEWYEAHRSELNEREREKSRNRPAQPGLRGRGRESKGWLDAAYCTENQYAEEICWDLNKEKIRKEHEE